MQSLGWTLIAGAIRYFLKVHPKVMEDFLMILEYMSNGAKDLNGKYQWLTESNRYLEWMRFESNPLLELVTLFTINYGQRLLEYRTAFAQDERRDGDVFDRYLLSPDFVLSFFQKVLARNDWPKENDTLEDAFEEGRSDMTMLERESIEEMP